MNVVRQLMLAAGALLATAAALAQPVTTSGVKFEESIELRGTKLQLNGAGTRFRGPFKVYAAGFYLTRKADTPEAVLNAPGPKRISVTMLRDIESNELGKLFSRSVEDNMDKTAFSKIIPGVIRMSQIFTDCKKLVAGDNFTVDWIPGTGTVITVNTPKCPQNNEPFKEPEFYNALARIWVGPNPADWKLKEALLGKPG